MKFNSAYHDMSLSSAVHHCTEILADLSAAMDALKARLPGFMPGAEEDRPDGVQYESANLVDSAHMSLKAGDKYWDGKLTEQGAERLYRMFDAGLTRHRAASRMDITQRAATLRYETWVRQGGVHREKGRLQ
jgi:hypothetical protein